MTVPNKNNPDIFGIDAKEAAKRLQDPSKKVQLIDVRTPEEFQSIHIPGATLIPLQDLTQRLNELHPNQDILLYCHSGVRSLKAAELLTQAGFNHVNHIKGGILAFSRQFTAPGL